MDLMIPIVDIDTIVYSSFIIRFLFIQHMERIIVFFFDK